MIPLGAHPLPKDLYNPQPDITVQTTGIELTSTQLDSAIKRLKTACESLQAELNELYRTTNGERCYGCWLVRLTPRGVEEIMEVRVAVVGNVDAGKSTTLGVLTRGSLDDGRGKVSIIVFCQMYDADRRHE
jgi:GTPase